MPVLTRKNRALIGIRGTTDEAESCMSTLSKLWRGTPSESSLLREIDALAHPLRGVDDLDALIASINVGQLLRQEHEHEGVCLIGFGTHHGTVIGGREWGAPMQRMEVPEARAGSYENAMMTPASVIPCSSFRRAMRWRRNTFAKFADTALSG